VEQFSPDRAEFTQADADPLARTTIPDEWCGWLYAYEHRAQVGVVGGNGAGADLLPQAAVSPATPLVVVTVGDMCQEALDLRDPAGSVLAVAQEPQKLVDKEPAVGDGGVGALRDLAIDEPVVGPSLQRSGGYRPAGIDKEKRCFLHSYPPIEQFGGQWNP